MDALNWRKASYSASNGGGCVEVADHDGIILVRDTTQHGHGPVHQFARTGWEAFTAAIRAGKFRRDDSGRLP